MNALMLLPLLWATTLAAQSTQTGGSVSGIVVNVANGNPVPRAVVVLRSAGPAGEPSQVDSYVTESDSSGNFLLKNIPPGAYELVAQHNMFEEPSREPRAGSRVRIDLGAGQELGDVRVTLTPLGAIFGTILGKEGRPIRNRNIEALTYSGKGTDRKEPSVVRWVWADDRGNYRIFGLPKGTYYLRVSDCKCEAPLNPRLRILGKKEQVAYSDTYFPAATNLSQAVPIDLPAGGDVRADVRLTPINTLTISGRIAEGDGRSGRVLVAISAASGATSFAADYGGEFFYPNAAPGTYIVRAIDREHGLSARQVVRLTDSDAYVILTLVPPIVLSGKVTVEGPRPVDVRATHITLTSDEQITRASSTPGPDGTFAFRTVERGVHAVSVVVPDDAYVKTVRFNNRRLRAPVIEVSESSDALLITIGTDAGDLTGSIVGLGDSTAQGAVAALVSAGEGSAMEAFARSTSVDERGRFEFRNIPPGDYRLLCLLGAGADKALAPDIQLRFGRAAKLVHIAPSSQAHVDIELIRIDE